MIPSLAKTQNQQKRAYHPIVLAFLGLALAAGVFAPWHGAKAAPAFIQANEFYYWGTNYGNMRAVTFNGNVTKGSVIAAGVTWTRFSSSLVSITAECTDGNFAVVDSYSYGSSSKQVTAYGIITRSGTCTVTATFSESFGGGELGAIVVHEIGGADVNHPLDGHAINHQDNPGTGTDAVTSGNITTSRNGDYIFGVETDAAGNNVVDVTGTGFVARNSAGGYYATEDKILFAAGLVAVTFTSTNGNDHPTTGIMAF